MSKSNTSKSTTLLAASDQNKPARIVVNGPAYKAFSEASVHVRNGYCFDTAEPPQVLLPFGDAIIHLKLADLDHYAIDAAAATIAHASALEHQTSEQLAAAEASRILADQALAAKRAELAADIAAQRAALAKLETEAATL